MIFSQRHSDVAETEWPHIAIENLPDSDRYIFLDNVAHVHGPTLAVAVEGDQDLAPTTIAARDPGRSDP